MQCLQTKFICVALLLMAGCGNQPSTPAVPLYIETITLKEKLANQDIANANYREALEAYQAVYIQYLKIDSHDDMARLLVNRFQTALIIEDIQAAKHAQAELQGLLLQSRNPRYEQRLSLLSANLAMVENQWPQALTLLAQIPSNESTEPALAARVNEAIVHFHQGGDISPLIQQLAPSLTAQPALVARMQRLQAVVALQNNDNVNTAKPFITAAKRYYQSISFPPGVAECMVLEAKLASLNDNTALAKQLEHRAKAIFTLIGNSHAISRHAL